jgi:hypothetical protein
VNLIISKEQKVSELRQAWIDALRNDISEYVGHLFSFRASWAATSAAPPLSGDVGAAFIKEQVETIQKLETLATRILLRVNPSEHNALVVLLQDADRIISSKKTLAESDALDMTIKAILTESQKLLKREWERVKAGETGFRLMRGASFALIFLALVTALGYCASSRG